MTTLADQGEQAAVNDVLGSSNVIVHARFAHHRGVVERVIGMMKAMSAVVAGPIALRQHGRLFDVLVIVSSLINLRLRDNPELFVKDSADGAASSADSDMIIE